MPVPAIVLKHQPVNGQTAVNLEIENALCLLKGQIAVLHQITDKALLAFARQLFYDPFRDSLIHKQGPKLFILLYLLAKRIGTGFFLGTQYMTYGLTHVREGLRHNVVQHIIYIKIVDVKGSSVDVCQAAELRHGNFGIGLDPQKPHQSLPNDTARILRPAIFGVDFFSLQNMAPSSTDSGNCFVSAQLPESDYC